MAKTVSKEKTLSTSSSMQPFLHPVAIGVLLGQGWHVYGDVVARGAIWGLVICTAGLLVGLACTMFLAAKAVSAQAQSSVRQSLFWMSCALNGGLSAIAQLRVRVGRDGPHADSEAFIVNSLLSSALLGCSLPHVVVKVARHPEAEIMMPCVLALLVTETCCGYESAPLLQVLISVFLLLIGIRGIVAGAAAGPVVIPPTPTQEARRTTPTVPTTPSANPATEPFFPATVLESRRYSPHFLVDRRSSCLASLGEAKPLVTLVARQTGPAESTRPAGKATREKPSTTSRPRPEGPRLEDPSGDLASTRLAEQSVSAEVGSDIRWDVIFEEMKLLGDEINLSKLPAGAAAALANVQAAQAIAQKAQSTSPESDAPPEVVFAALEGEDCSSLQDEGVKEEKQREAEGHEESVPPSLWFPPGISEISVADPAPQEVAAHSSSPVGAAGSQGAPEAPEVAVHLDSSMGIDLLPPVPQGFQGITPSVPFFSTTVPSNHIASQEGPAGPEELLRRHSADVQPPVPVAPSAPTWSPMSRLSPPISSGVWPSGDDASLSASAMEFTPGQLDAWPDSLADTKLRPTAEAFTPSYMDGAMDEQLLHEASAYGEFGYHEGEGWEESAWAGPSSVDPSVMETSGAWDDYGPYAGDASGYLYEDEAAAGSSASADGLEYAAGYWAVPGVGSSIPSGTTIQRLAVNAPRVQRQPIKPLLDPSLPDPGPGRASLVRREAEASRSGVKAGAAVDSSAAAGAGNSHSRTLLVSPLEPWMDEAYVIALFAASTPVVSVKIVSGYLGGIGAFVELASRDDALRSLQGLSAGGLITSPDGWQLKVRWAPAKVDAKQTQQAPLQGLTPLSLSKSRAGDVASALGRRSSKGDTDATREREALRVRMSNGAESRGLPGGRRPDGPDAGQSAPASKGANTKGPVDATDMYWAYLDPRGKVQMGFTTEEMRMWFEMGYFKGDLPVALAKGKAIKEPPSKFFYPLKQWFPEASKSFTFIPKY